VVPETTCLACPVLGPSGAKNNELETSLSAGLLNGIGLRAGLGAGAEGMPDAPVVQGLPRFRKRAQILHCQTKKVGLAFAPRRRRAPWCNGNTTDFDSVFPGSSPGGAALQKLSRRLAIFQGCQNEQIGLAFARRRQRAPWCNGNTTDSDSVFLGSSPGGAALFPRIWRVRESACGSLRWKRSFLR
jgi:hypothetical protein